MPACGRRARAVAACNTAIPLSTLGYSVLSRYSGCVVPCHGGIRNVSDNDKLQKRRELLAFLFLTIVLAPILSVVIVGGYGFLVWMYQLMAGPPGSWAA